MVVTDLDGTLARSDSSICPVDIETLERIGDSGICRVIATGRSYFSACKILTPDFPIDFLVFSCGTGVMDWKTKEIINTQHLPKDKVENIAKVLLDHRVDFSIQDKIPDNHYFSYILHNKNNEDFKRRLAIYDGYTRPLDISKIGEASQVIAILGEDTDWFDELSGMFTDVKVIRATSPLDGKTLWMEFFPQHVSKSYGIKYLCELLNISRDQTVGLGNDYNDLDLLSYCKYSFVVDNAPEELKKKYPAVASNDMNGLTHLVNKLIRSS
ncbi:MAG: HAD-IIB family hydrolase [Desulfuromusa sp.]|nr:HAD-IIB family hydrolase [Desulfuromusa sp.]